MRILVLHQNKFDRLGYERAFDHDRHDLAYVGSAENIANIPNHVRCEKFVWDPAQPVADQLRPWLRDRPRFDRILARHELLILPAAELRAEFGIAGMQPEQARNYRDKVVMKSTLARNGIRVPRFVPAGDLPERAPWPGKAVVKPRGQNASQGVFLCADYADARELIAAQQSRDPTFGGRYEVEEFIEGPIWHIDGYLFRGEPVAIQAARYIGAPLSFEDGEPIGSVQYGNPDLEAWTLECLRVLGGDNLTFHLEAFTTPEGPVFLEVAARCGGGHIVEMFRRRTGVHLHTLDMASEVAGELATHLIGSPSADYNGMFLYPGHTYGGAACDVVVPDALLNDPRLVKYQIFPPNTATPTKGNYRPENLAFSGIVSGPDPAGLEAWLRGLMAQVRIVLQPVREPIEM